MGSGGREGMPSRETMARQSQVRHPVKAGWVLGCELQLADDHFVHGDSVLPHVLQDVDEIGVVQLL